MRPPVDPSLTFRRAWRNNFIITKQTSRSESFLSVDAGLVNKQTALIMEGPVRIELGTNGKSSPRNDDSPAVCFPFVLEDVFQN